MSTSRWSRWVTIAAVLLALIAALVSYSHMYELAPAMVSRMRPCSRYTSPA